MFYLTASYDEAMPYSSGYGYYKPVENELILQDFQPQLVDARALARMNYTAFLVIYYGAVVPNVGDYMSGVIVAEVLRRLGHNETLLIVSSLRDRRFRKLLAIGSILDHASPGDSVWGTGARNEKLQIAPGVDLRAVRGPKTEALLRKKFLTSAPLSALGDPLLLLPELFPELCAAQEKLFDVLLIPHYEQFVRLQLDFWQAGGPFTELVQRGKRLEILDLRNVLEWRTIIQTAAKAEFIVTSSLHGLILGDVLGVPTRLFSEKHSEIGLFKFEDYFAATGRSLTFASSIEEALAMGPHEPLEFDTKPLWDTFPLDLIQDFRLYRSAVEKDLAQ